MLRRLALAALVAAPAAAQEAGAPLSAIDWLSQSVGGAGGVASAPLNEPPVASDASTPGIVVTPLDGTATAGGGLVAGVLPPEATGLPRTIWGASDEAALVGLIEGEGPETLPALQDLTVALMLAQADPPAGGGRDLALARVDRLLAMGALAEAQALLESGDLLDPELFRRWFDVTLLRGTERQACEVLRETPSLAPTLMARVFCLARNGDWPAAALTLNTARALGDIAPDEEAILTRFLDPEAEVAGDEAPPSRPSPLVFRLREAVGESVPTAGLPLAFSHADLRTTAAWRAQMEAAERLARAGALPVEDLAALYRARRPAASGGVWDRAAAIQRLDAALGSGDPAETGAAVVAAWEAMEAAGLEAPFGKLHGDQLAAIGLPGEAGALAFRAALLSPAYEAAATARVAASAQEALWIGVARGDLTGIAATDGASAAVLAGFSGAPVPEEAALAIADGRVGEAILRAVADVRQGLDGDHAAATDALATLRALGLEDAARRAALQVLLLGPAS